MTGMEIVEASDKQKHRAFWQMLHYLGGEDGESKKSLFPCGSGHKAQDFCCVLSAPPEQSFCQLLFKSHQINIPHIKAGIFKSILLLKIVTTGKISNLDSVGLVHQRPRKGQNRWLRKIDIWGEGRGEDERTIIGG